MLSRLSRLSSILAAVQTSPSPWDEVDVLSANVLSATESVEPFVVVVPQAVMKFHPSFDKALYGVLHVFLAANVRILVVIVDHGAFLPRLRPVFTDRFTHARSFCRRKNSGNPCEPPPAAPSLGTVSCQLRFRAGASRCVPAAPGPRTVFGATQRCNRCA